MRLFSQLFLTLTTLFILSACEGNVGVCTEDSECPASQKCSTGRGQCVECLGNGDCGEDSFCCEGTCRGIEEADRYCGCAVDLGGFPGIDCSEYTLTSDDLAGGACQDGGDLVTVDNVRQGTCGCTQSGPDQCGMDEASGLYGLCIMESSEEGGRCIVQSADNCGTVGSTCTTWTGGPLCLPADETGSGTCTCDGNNNNCLETVTDDLGNQHSVANNCSFENTCACANIGEACNPNGAAPDCCGDGCFDLLSDSDNCGICGKSCGDNECISGACACSADNDCYAEGGSFNNPQNIANECEGATASGELGSCVCASYRDASGGTSACPLGSFCCFAGGDVTANGCCSKPCGEATLEDCTQSVPE